MLVTRGRKGRQVTWSILYVEFTGFIFSASFAQVATCMGFVSLGPGGSERSGGPRARGKDMPGMASSLQKGHAAGIAGLIKVWSLFLFLAPLQPLISYRCLWAFVFIIGKTVM